MCLEELRNGVLESKIESTGQGEDVSEYSVEIRDKALGMTSSAEEKAKKVLVNLSPVDSDPIVVGEHTQENHSTASICGNLLSELFQELSNAISES